MALKKAKATAPAAPVKTAPVKATKTAPATPPPPAGVGLIGFIGDRAAYANDYPSAPDPSTLIMEKGLTEIELVPLADTAAIAAFRKEHGYGV